jgi:hypothetical protein
MGFEGSQKHKIHYENNWLQIPVSKKLQNYQDAHKETAH